MKIKISTLKYFTIIKKVVFLLLVSTTLLAPTISNAELNWYDPCPTGQKRDWSWECVDSDGSLTAAWDAIANGGLTSPFDSLLYSIFWLLSLLTTGFGTLFNTVLQPSFFDDIFRSGNILYTGWSFVRDFFNMAFVLVLLFSAFATIFQIQKYHLKNTLLMIVLMALLVNFSWPIARVIIDLSNVLMFYFMNNLFTGSDLSSQVASVMNIREGLFPNGQSDATAFGTAYILFAIIVIFTLLITIASLALLFMIRVGVLAFLLILAPIGFVGAVIPSMQNTASRWWDALFKQAFFAPAALFLLFIAFGLSNSIYGESDSNNALLALQQAAADSSVGSIVGFVKALPAVAIPLVFIWLSLIVAKQMGAIGAGIVTGKAGAVMRGSGRWARRGTLGGAVLGARGVDRGVRAVRRGVANKFGTNNKLFNPEARSVEGMGRSAIQRGKNVVKSAKEKHEDIIKQDVARGLASGGVGSDKKALEKYKTETTNKYIADKLDKKVELDDAIDMRKTASAGSVEAAALDKFISSHKDLQYASPETAEKVAGLLSDTDRKRDPDKEKERQENNKSKISEGATRAIMGTLKKNGKALELASAYDKKDAHGTITKGINTQEFADGVVKSMDAESLAKSSSLLNEAAKNMDGETAKTIAIKMQHPEFRNDFYKHAGAQGINRSIAQRFEAPSGNIYEIVAQVENENKTIGS